MNASVVSRFSTGSAVAVGRGRRLALSLPLAVVMATGLSACNDPQHVDAAQDAGRGTASASASASASTTPSAAAPPSPSPTPERRNGTAGNGLTISDGTRFVVMNGTEVDFGTEVKELTWSPDGKKAAFIDGTGDLVVAGPDGTGRTVIAKNPGGQVWTHPTWQVTVADQYQQDRSNLLFTAEQSNVLRLMTVTATAGATPKPLGLAAGDAPALPQTGNTWINAGGAHGRTVYANRNTGEVFIRDQYLRQQGGALAKGSEPALSPDGGDDIVFVRSVDGHAHLFGMNGGGGDVHDLTPKATTDYAAPAFSPDGKTVAARTAQGIVTLPADGSAAPTLVSEYTGTPAYRG